VFASISSRHLERCERDFDQNKTELAAPKEEALGSTQERSCMTGKKPVHEIRLNGIRGAVWSNTNKEGQVWFNITVTRNYRDGDQWKESTNFGRDDLPALSKVADLVLAWIVSAQAKPNHERESSKEPHSEF